MRNEKNSTPINSNKQYIFGWTAFETCVKVFLNWLYNPISQFNLQKGSFIQLFTQYSFSLQTLVLTAYRFFSLFSSVIKKLFTLRPLGRSTFRDLNWAIREKRFVKWKSWKNFFKIMKLLLKINRKDRKQCFQSKQNDSYSKLLEDHSIFSLLLFFLKLEQIQQIITLFWKLGRLSLRVWLDF